MPFKRAVNYGIFGSWDISGRDPFCKSIAHTSSGGKKENCQKLKVRTLGLTLNRTLPLSRLFCY